MIRIIDLSAIITVILFFVFMLAVKTQNKKIFFFIFIVSCIIVSVRTIGDDTIEYIGIYNAAIPSFSWDSITQINGFRIETLWANFISLLKILGFSSHYVFFFLSIIIPSLALLWVYNNMNIFPATTLALFYFLFWLLLYQYAINGIRAFASACFVFIALWFLYNKKHLACLLVCIFAICLHTSGFIVLFFILIFRMKINLRFLFFLMFSLLIIAIVSMQLDWNQPLLSRLHSKLVYYLFSVENDMLINNDGRVAYVFFARALFISSVIYSLVILLISKDVCKSHGFINGLYNVSLVTTFICIIMLLFGIYLFSYRVIIFIQPALVFISLYSGYFKPSRSKVSIFVSVTGFHWLIFILYASRFYDS